MNEKMQKISTKKLLTVILPLGFASGLPLSLTGSTIQAWFTEAGVDLMTLGLLSILGVPYVYKFLWAPLLDRFHLSFLGFRRGWIALFQLLLAALFFSFALLDPAQAPKMIMVIALIIALLSASMDIVIDAYRTELLTESERGMGAAWHVSGYRFAMLVSGGFALMLADQIGWAFTFSILAVLMLLSSLATLFAQKEAAIKHPESIKQAIKEPLLELWQRGGILYILLFIVLYKLADAFVLTLNTTFLLRELHFSLTEIGFANKFFGLAATLLGVFVGGSLINRLGMFKALLYFGILQAVSNLCFYALAVVGHHFPLMLSAVFIENLCGGMGTAAFTAFVMSLCNPHYTASQYALLSALSAVGRVSLGPVAAIVISKFGWQDFYLLTVVVALPGLGVLLVLGVADILHLREDRV